MATAVFEHDRGWIDLDDTPFWNDRSGAPYSFIDFPLVPKIAFYRKGIDEVERMNRYAALLCSLHYASFFERETHPAGVNYLREERERQRRLKRELRIDSQEAEDALQFHFELLQFCDRLSLYICLNEPGVKKADEFAWYREGFPHSERFPFAANRKIVAYWLDEQRVSLSAFPFEQPFLASVMIKAVGKPDIAEYGLAQAYERTPWTERKVTLVPG